MHKHALALTAALALSFSLSACDAKEEKKDDKKADAKKDDAKKDEKKADEKKEGGW